MRHAIFRAAVLLFAFAAPIASQAASTTNFSDQWWTPSESGWGASVLQQRDVLFIDLFVYGSDGRPTWFTAAAFLQPATANGHLTFLGDLYMNAGPWYGSTFNPAVVANRRVGTLTFDADSSDSATLTYSVDGVLVTKSVTRQLWAYEDFTGTYNGGVVYDLSQCANASSNGHVEELGPVSIQQTTNTVFNMTTQSGTTSCTWGGTYSQLGHMGTVVGTYSCNNGVQANFTAYELERTASGFTGRFVANDNFSCTVNGRLGGLQR